MRAFPDEFLSSDVYLSPRGDVGTSFRGENLTDGGSLKTGGIITMENYVGAKSAPQKRETQVTIEVSRCQRLVSEAQTVVSELENRLQPVLRDIGPSGGAKLAKDKEFKVGLASVLANENDNISSLIARIGNIIERLEI